MSRHEGVSCDSCLKSNFRGRRYKCLICYDYDLCASCYENGATAARHTTDHPMQCILTRSDFDLYYGGEALGLEQPQAYTCPFCNRMGFTDSTLQEHVTAEHSEITQEVVCPVCAAVPGGEPNLLTDDFAGHLTLEHRTGPRDLISFLDEPTAIRHGGVRRIPHSGRGARARRSNMHFSTSGGLSALSPSSRDAVVDPIAELLSQLSGARRVTGSSAHSAPAAPSQLQQLQMQLQLERQQVSVLFQAARQQQLERVPRRSGGGASAAGGASGGAAGAASHSGSGTAPPAAHPPPAHPHAQHPHSQAHSAEVTAATPSQFLLTRFLSATPSEEERVELEAERTRRGSFLRAAVLGSLGRLPPPTPPPRQPSPSPSPSPAATAAPLPAPPPPRPAACKTRKQELKPAPPPRAAHPTEGR